MKAVHRRSNGARARHRPGERARLRIDALAAGGAWLLAMHFMDLYWQVMPTLHPEGVRPSVLDVADYPPGALTLPKPVTRADVAALVDGVRGRAARR